MSLLNILKRVSWEIHLPCREAKGEECQDCWVDASTMCLFARGAASSLTDIGRVRQLSSLLAGCLLASFPQLLWGNLPLCSPFSLPFHISTFPLDLFPNICPSYTTATVHTKCPFHVECPRLAHYCSIPWLEIACLRASRVPHMAQVSYTVPLSHQTGLCKPTQTFECLFKHWTCSKLHPNPRNTIISKNIISSNAWNKVP